MSKHDLLLYACTLLSRTQEDEWLRLLHGSMPAQPRMLLLVRPIELDRCGQLWKGCYLPQTQLQSRKGVFLAGLADEQLMDLPSRQTSVMSLASVPPQTTPPVCLSPIIWVPAVSLRPAGS